MKKWKKISAWLLGMTMTLAAAAPVSAAEHPTKGSITIHKFQVETQAEYEELKNAGDLSGGNELNLQDYESLKNLKPLDGISFTLTQVEDKSGLTVENAQTLLNGHNATLTTDEKGELTFTDLPLGVYKLEENPDSRVKTPMDPVLISVPTYNQAHKTDPSKAEFLYDIHVYPKNLLHQDGPDIGKDVIEEGNNDGSVHMDEEFPWIILADIPDGLTGTGEKESYKIWDNLDPRLDFVRSDSVVLRSADQNTKVELKKDVDYIFTNDPERHLSWEMTKVGLAKMAEEELKGGKVVVTFTTKLNTSADLGEAIPNQAHLDFTNASGDRYTPESDIPEVHTGGVSIKKLDKSDQQTLLSGAKFKIYESEEDAKKEQNAVQRYGQDYVVTSGQDGVATFTGLKYNDTLGQGPTEGSKTYWIVETEAPEGYNRLLDPFEITVTSTSHTQDPADYLIVYNAKDNYKLPFTGGMGILIFAGGAAVLLGAAYLLSRHDGKKAAK